MMPIFNHTTYILKQIVEPTIVSHATNIMPRINNRFVGHQNGPIFHEHAIECLHIILGMVLHVLAHML